MIAGGIVAVGVEPTRIFLASIGAPQDLIEKVAHLVVCHMRTRNLVDADNAASRRLVKRIARDLFPATIAQLYRLIFVDAAGRPPRRSSRNPGAERMLDIASGMDIQHNPPKEILMGRHLIDLGMKPGREMGVLLADAYQEQLDGGFEDLGEAIQWAKNRLSDI